MMENGTMFFGMVISICIVGFMTHSEKKYTMSKEFRNAIITAAKKYGGRQTKDASGTIGFPLFITEGTF